MRLKSDLPASFEKRNYKTLSLLITSIAVFLIAFMIPALNVALPRIGQEFNADAILLNWIVTAYVVTIAVFSIPFGRIADIIGIKKIFGIGLIIYTLTSALIMCSSSSFILVTGRALQGVGGAMILVSSLALITAIYPACERGRALGISLACISVGSSAGPYLGGLLTENLGWRSIFGFVIPFGLILAMLLFWRIKGEWAAARGEKFDLTGSIIFAITITFLMYGFSILPDVLGGVFIFAGLLGLVAFFKWESRTYVPVLNVNVFRNNRPFVFSNLTALINFSAVAAMVYFLSLYLQYIKGLSPAQAGLILIAQPVLQAILSPFAGILSEKIEPRIVATMGMALTFGGLLSFVFLTKDSSIWPIIVALIVLGAGFALFLSPNTNAIMSSVSPQFYGIASATMSTMISMGNMLSMGITMVVMALVIGRVEITSESYPAFITSTRVAFGIFSFLCFSGIFVSLFRGKSATRSENPRDGS